MKSILLQKSHNNDWFKLKRYPHIGLQFEPKDRLWLEKYIKNKKLIASHSFCPFVHRQIIVRKFRKEICHDGTRSILRKPSKKTRDIYFSNHFDSNIFSYYSELLSTAYERVISETGLNNCVSAYRRIKLNPEIENSRNKCNIDFANDIFEYIKSEKGKNLVAITFDIKSFFDNLDHQLLKKLWIRVIKSNKDLPPDHYNVYRNITKFSFVDEKDLFKQYRNQIIVQRKPNKLLKKRIDKSIYLRNQRAVAYCSKENINEIRKLGLIKNNKYNIEKDIKNDLRIKGIPQGSPISAILANIYMLDFDKKIFDFLVKLDGVYQRYSDDMIVICPIENEKKVIEHFLTTIKDYKLEIQEAKTQVFHFLYDSEKNRHFCFENNLNTSKLQTNTLIEYLGFQFDGKYTLIKNSSVSNYYRKMKKSFCRSNFYTYHNKTKTKGEIFKNRLYKKFTHIGSGRRRIYKRHPKIKNMFILSHKYDWGNFISYARLAEDTILDNKISRQLKNHWKNFHKLMRNIEKN